MKTLFGILFLVAFGCAVSAQRGNVGRGITPPASTTATVSNLANQEVKVPLIDTLVGLVKWAPEDGVEKVTSQELVQRFDAEGKPRTAWARLTLLCSDGESAEVNLVTSLSGEEVSVGNRAKLLMSGYSPVRNITDAIQTIESAGISEQQKMLSILKSQVAKACGAKNTAEYKAEGYHLAISFWVNTKGQWSFGVPRVPKQKFEWLKKE